MNAAAPGWQPDPTRRHEYRYWDGSQWTDDVSDGGVTSVDPVAGAGAQPSGEATAPYGYSGAGMPPGVSGPQPYGGGPGGAPYPYSGDQYPPDQPVKKGPSPALLIAIAVIVVLAIGGVAFALSQGGDDDGGETASDTSETTAPGDTGTTAPGDTGSTAPGSSDTTAAGGDTDSTAPGGESSSVIVDAMAEEIENSSGGQLNAEQSQCVAQAMVDEFGVERLAELGLSQQESGQNPIEMLSPEEQEAIFDLMTECMAG